MRIKKIYLFFIAFCFLAVQLKAQDTIKISSYDQLSKIQGSISYLEDKTGSLSINDAKKSEFKITNGDVPNFQISKSTFWVKILLENKTDQNDFVLNIDYPTIDELMLFSSSIPIDENKFDKLGEFKNFSERYYDHQSYLFNIILPKNKTSTFYLKIKASEQLQLPMSIGSPKAVLESLFNKDLIFGLYIGIILAMVFYNFFIYFTVRDQNYLWYVAYILFTGLTQAMLQGYTFRFLWPNLPSFNNHSAYLIPFLNGIAAVEFTRRFLHVKKYSNFYNNALLIVISLYVICLLLGLSGLNIAAQNAIQLTAFLASILVFVVAVSFSRRGDRTAKFFLFAWSIFLLSVCIFVMRNFNVLPFNNFTHYALQVGSAIEVILLSFALADKINIYRIEKEISQAEALRSAEENQRIISEQNIVLEGKVKERTGALQIANTELSKTLDNLKDTQSQLVDAEKMASLGQLTAGIAHEINNPINFVISNVKPLRRDIDDVLSVIKKYEEIDEQTDLRKKLLEIKTFKQEIDMDYLVDEINSLLKGVGEGATRTSEIIKGLRVFSRVDEVDIKKADIHQGIDSTLTLLNSTMKGKTEVIKNYDNLPPIECYAGKLNQLFMNILSNAIQIVNSNPPSKPPKITITTLKKNNDVIITIEDNGAGMSAETKKRIFEPFFTTKNVGEGTGLGLSIVFSIIEKHHGTIDVESELEVGTKFIICIPISQSRNSTN